MWELIREFYRASAASGSDDPLHELLAVFFVCRLIITTSVAFGALVVLAFFGS